MKTATLLQAEATRLQRLAELPLNNKLFANFKKIDMDYQDQITDTEMDKKAERATTLREAVKQGSIDEETYTRLVENEDAYDEYMAREN